MGRRISSRNFGLELRSQTVRSIRAVDIKDEDNDAVELVLNSGTKYHITTEAGRITAVLINITQHARPIRVVQEQWDVNAEHEVHVFAANGLRQFAVYATGPIVLDLMS